MLKSFKLLSFIPFLLVGCGSKDDPELLKELEDKKAEVQAIEEELEAVAAELKEIRKTDPSEELSMMKLEIEKAAARKVEVEEKVLELAEARKKAEADLADYQAKYRLR